MRGVGLSRRRRRPRQQRGRPRASNSRTSLGFARRICAIAPLHRPICKPTGLESRRKHEALADVAADIVQPLPARIRFDPFGDDFTLPVARNALSEQPRWKASGERSYNSRYLLMEATSCCCLLNMLKPCDTYSVSSRDADVAWQDRFNNES